MSYQGIKLSASVICMNWLNLKSSLEKMAQLYIDYLHYDICDSYFVPEFGLPFYLIQKIIDNTSIQSDYHIMVEEPKRIFEFIPFQKGARVNIHYEACRNLHRELVALRRMGFLPGVVINPATTLDQIEYVIEEVSQVTIMTVNPGFPSQQMIPQCLKKIQRLKDWKKQAGYELSIIADGNVSFENIPAMIAAGADTLVLGTSGLFVNGLTIDECFEQLMNAINKGMGV